MALNVPVFLTRLASSVVFVAVMLTGLLWNEWAFLALTCLINILSLNEYFRLVQKINKNNRTPALLQIATQILGLFLLFLFYLKPSQEWDNTLWGISRLLPVVPVIILLSSILSKKVFFPASIHSLGGLLYITVPMILLLQLRMQDFVLPLSLIVMIWSNDTMAYLVGSFVGKTPFSPISPKKTWEGTVGGAVITLAAAGITGYCTHTFRIIDWLMLALCATVAGTFGDLMESKLKRMADIKDSGKLMPGHGGALDRFDSLLVAIPFAFLYVNYFMR